MNWEDILKRDIQFRVTKQELYHIFVECMVDGGQFRGFYGGREHTNNMRTRITTWKTEPTTEPRSDIIGPENFWIIFKHSNENLNNPISFLGNNEIIYLEEMWLQGHGGNKQMPLNRGEMVFIMGMFKDEYPDIFMQMAKLVAAAMSQHDLESTSKVDNYYEE